MSDSQSEELREKAEEVADSIIAKVVESYRQNGRSDLDSQGIAHEHLASWIVGEIGDLITHHTEQAVLRGRIEELRQVTQGYSGLSDARMRSVKMGEVLDRLATLQSQLREELGDA